jgi:hypothetical protein
VITDACGSALWCRSIARARASRADADGQLSVAFGVGLGVATGSAVCGFRVLTGVGEAVVAAGFGVAVAVRVGVGFGVGEAVVAAGVGVAVDSAPDSDEPPCPETALARAIPAMATNSATMTSRTPLRWLWPEYLERRRRTGRPLTTLFCGRRPDGRLGFLG